MSKSIRHGQGNKGRKVQQNDDSGLPLGALAEINRALCKKLSEPKYTLGRKGYNEF